MLPTPNRGTQLYELDQLTTRATGIQERLDAFDEDAAALIAISAVDLVSWPLHDAIAELDRSVSDAIQARASRVTLEGELDAVRGELASANPSVDVAAHASAAHLDRRSASDSGQRERRRRTAGARLVRRPTPSPGDG